MNCALRFWIAREKCCSPGLLSGCRKGTYGKLFLRQDEWTKVKDPAFSARFEM